MSEAPPVAALVDGWIAWGSWTADPQSSDRSAALAGHGDFLWTVKEHPERAWEAIVAVVADAGARKFLGLLAAGPVEDLLALHGPQFIDRIEKAAREDATLASVLEGVWQFTMSDEIWERVQLVKGVALVGQVSSQTPNKSLERTRDG
jgi:uncharacterized protein DUF6869